MADEDFISALDDAREVELTVTGRRSGREITIPVWSVREGDRFDLVPITGTDSQWYRNVLATPTIRLAVGGRQSTAHASPVADPARVEQILDRFREKYGAGAVEDYYPKKDAAVEVRLD